MEQQTPNFGQCGVDEETFLRVWRRVMPEESPDCPIVTVRAQPREETAPAVPTAAPMPRSAQPVPQAAPPAVPMTQPAMPARQAPAVLPAPREEEVTAAQARQLLALLTEALADRRYYQALAARAKGGAGRTLSRFAQEAEGHAKRLCAACFLLTGVRHWPGAGTAAVPATYWGGLRERYWAERKGAEVCRGAADSGADPMLRELYLDLAEARAARAHQIKMLLEQG